MKKIIVILILVVYIASIAVVNFFGLETKIFDGITYVSDIQCNSVTLQRENPIVLDPEDYLLKGKKVFKFDFIPAPEGNPYTTENDSIISNPNTVQINYEVLPHLADERGVKFEVDLEGSEGVVFYHEISKTLVFIKPNRGITVTLKSQDGSNISTQIYILGILNN